ncbi:TIGR02710 family CRISPR-associated CARF protein [Rubellimicrobium sp. CFH 75288]|uniref:TIGR02710 family CRISPR-associated CARF protein n=1 Tax=Rubellimicrobium sp. CFH 75288 TaxID=2697034 RepID=UPI001413767B|nr:TIGR02710 family CRISPR-associated CARF protein [Rubellimicrobium sp. CFH 75288]NAZ37434.1 TIGR02710 family CRISPR-associated protein [Rubellimicrobium sp. CFH 75288]
MMDTAAMDAETVRTLVLTVGGSPQPLRTAIEGGRWDRVLFVVSDGSGGTPSSRGQVEEAALHDRAGGDPLPGPGLRHLPATPQDTAVIEVPPDDLDRALAAIDAALSAEIAAGRHVTVDYTGGTKTMTAAMVLAATAQEGVALQFMAGRRSDLRQVEAGSEAPVAMPGELLGLARLFATARAFTARRNYAAALAVMGEADKTLRQARVRVPQAWTERIALWRGWLEILTPWDRFRHGQSWDLCQKALRRGGPLAAALEAAALPARIEALDKAAGKPEPVLLEDLWLNALRRADLGLWDDAVARLYRLAEAAVQCRLWTVHGLETKAIPWDLLTEAERQGLRPTRDKGGDIVELSLTRALSLVARFEPRDPVAASWDRREDGSFRSPRWQADRNHSILAHGFEALKEKDWTTARQWFDFRRPAFWEAALGRPTAAQLPDRLP